MPAGNEPWNAPAVGSKAECQEIVHLCSCEALASPNATLKGRSYIEDILLLRILESGETKYEKRF